MQHDDATIKQSGRDEMRHIDEARRDATTRRLDDDDETNDERRDVAERRGAATRRDGTRQQGAERRRNNQPKEQTNGRPNKQSGCDVRRRRGRWTRARGWRRRMIFWAVCCWGERLCRLPLNVGISTTLDQISSVRGTSMSGKHDTKVCRHTGIHVAKFPLSSRK